jgi:FAD/FMN-containing dehydrogenase
MRNLKRSFDPSDLMNPGKIIPTDGAATGKAG